MLDSGVVLFSDHFEENLSTTADSKLYVMSPLLLSINPDDFEPIAAYLRDEIFPDDAGAVVWEDRQQKTEAKMLMDLKPCAMTCYIAEKLGFCDFTFAVKGKLKSMRSGGYEGIHGHVPVLAPQWSGGERYSSGQDWKLACGTFLGTDENRRRRVERAHGQQPRSQRKGPEEVTAGREETVEKWSWRACRPRNLVKQRLRDPRYRSLTH